MKLVLLSGILLFLNLVICLANYIIYNKMKKEETKSKGIDKFYIICPFCGKKIKLSQTHIYMEENNNDGI